MSKSEAKIPTYFSEPYLTPINLTENRIGNSPIETRLTYTNNLTVPVVVVLRSGLKFEVYPQRSLTNNQLIIKQTVIINQIVKSDIQHILSGVSGDSSVELKAMREAFTLQVNQNTYGGATIVLDYPLTIETLRKLGGTVYLHELDILITLENISNASEHPYSEKGIRDTLMVTSNILEHGFNYAIELVDNESRYGDRFINICHRIYRVSTIKDYGRKDGVYIKSNNHIEGEFSKTDITIKHYPFEYAEENLGLYKSMEEAVSNGDVNLARKHELTKLEHCIGLQKAELSQLKNAQEKATLELEQETKNRDKEREVFMHLLKEVREQAEYNMAMEKQRLKDYYESRSYERKDSSEVIRWLPAIVSALFTAAAVIMKLQTKK